MNHSTLFSAAQGATETCSTCGETGPASDFRVFDYSHNPAIAKVLSRAVYCLDVRACRAREEAAVQARCTAMVDAAVARRLGGAA